MTVRHTLPAKGTYITLWTDGCLVIRNVILVLDGFSTKFKTTWWVIIGIYFQINYYFSTKLDPLYIVANNTAIYVTKAHKADHRAPSQYVKRRLSVRSRKVSKPRDLYLELSDRYEIWQALRQQCCRCACQISKRYENLKYQSRGFETLRDLMERRLFFASNINRLQNFTCYFHKYMEPHGVQCVLRWLE